MNDWEENIKGIFEKNNFEWVDDVEDGRYIYFSKGDSALTNPLVKDLRDLYLKSKLSQLDQIIEWIEEARVISFAEGDEWKITQDIISYLQQLKQSEEGKTGT